jgi:hypothetical protein
MTAGNYRRSALGIAETEPTSSHVFIGIELVILPRDFFPTAFLYYVLDEKSR